MAAIVHQFLPNGQVEVCVCVCCVHVFILRLFYDHLTPHFVKQALYNIPTFHMYQEILKYCWNYSVQYWWLFIGFVLQNKFWWNFQFLILQQILTTWKTLQLIKCLFCFQLLFMNHKLVKQYEKQLDTTLTGKHWMIIVINLIL